MTTPRVILELCRHELAVLLRTRRAVLITTLYLGLAILGGLVYVVVTRFGEEKALELARMSASDDAVARENMVMQMERGYEALTTWLAGVDNPLDVTKSFRDSVILPIFFWCSLLLMPFVIIFTSFDLMSSELEARSLCYSILRARRSEILLGKLLAHAAVFTLLTAVASAVLVLVASALLESISILDAPLGLLRVWLLLIPFGLCYLGITAFCSSATTQPTTALLSAIGIIIGLRVVGWTSVIPEESDWAMLRHVRWVSPAQYHDGLWLAELAPPLISSAAYLGFGAVFTILGMWVLGARDL